MFSGKHVHVFPKSRTCFGKFTYVFFRKHVRLFLKTRTCFFEVILTLPMKYISYVQRRYTSSGIDVYLRKKACHPRDYA